jgi:hypothetical protein
MTAMADAFEKNGLTKTDAEFDIAISKYLNSGGTIDRAYHRLNVAAAKMSGMGQCAIVTGQSRGAQTRQQVEGGEAYRTVPDGHCFAATSPSSNRGGDGRNPSAQERPFVVASPVREPTASQRSAALSAAKVASISVMDTLKIDGRSIGDWTVAEARKRGHDKTREGYILTAAARVVANAPANALIRDVVKVRELQRIQQQAMEAADAV